MTNNQADGDFATCVSCFFSSHGFVQLFGVLLMLLSFIAAYLVHAMAFFSIWCFFAAILSLLIYLHLRFRDLGGFPKERRSRWANTLSSPTARQDEVSKIKDTLAVTKHQGMKEHACCVNEPIDGRKAERKPANQPFEITKGTRIL